MTIPTLFQASVLCSFAFASSTLAQSAYAEPAIAPAATTVTDISAALDEIIREHDVPALAALAIVGDGPIAQGVAGVRARGGGPLVVATLGDQWHLGSCGKAMTATLAGLLVDRQALAWETTLLDVFPRLAQSADASWQAPTLADFITNSGGVPSDLSKGGLWLRLGQTCELPAQARRMLLDGVTREPTIAPPGTKFEYANAGFAIAGAMVERTLGVPFEQAIQRELFVPLGITSAGFGPPGVPGVTAQPMGHSPAGVPLPPTRDADNPMAIAPAGCMHMTINDWGKFAMLHARAHRDNPHRTVRMLTPQAFDLLHAPRLEQYAGGWIVDSRPWADGDDVEGEGQAKEGIVLNHAGSNTMWYAVVWIAPERDMALLACANMGGDAGQMATDDAIVALLEAVNNAAPDAAR